MSENPRMRIVEEERWRLGIEISSFLLYGHSDGGGLRGDGIVLEAPRPSRIECKLPELSSLQHLAAIKGALSAFGACPWVYGSCGTRGGDPQSFSRIIGKSYRFPFLDGQRLRFETVARVRDEILESLALRKVRHDFIRGRRGLVGFRYGSSVAGGLRWSPRRDVRERGYRKKSDKNNDWFLQVGHAHILVRKFRSVVTCPHSVIRKNSPACCGTFELNILSRGRRRW